MPTNETSSDNIALLIDTDNAPAEKTNTIIAELPSYGSVCIRRAYGNGDESLLPPLHRLLSLGASIITRALSLLLILFLGASAQADDRITKTAELLKSYSDSRLFNGAILVAQGDDVLYEAGFGLAQMEWQIPNTPDTRFRIGSITKQFTAALILQLVEEEKIDLEEKVTDYLPSYPKANGDRITIHHLLSHTAGIPSYTSFPNFGNELVRNPYEPTAFLEEFSEQDLQFEPGSEYAYSNSGYFLLGAIIEAVTGTSYEIALENRLLKPLDLQHTGYEHNSDVIAKRASGYKRTAIGWDRADYLDTSIPYAAGMIYSTVQDLHKWTRALHSGKVFKKAETFNKMITPNKNNYGYGLRIRTQKMGEQRIQTIGHGGAINGFKSSLSYQPENQYTIVTLDNTEGQADRASGAINRILHGLPTKAPAKPIAETLIPIIENNSLKAAVDRYRDLKENHASEYAFGEPQLNELGQYYIDNNNNNNNNSETAIALLELNLETYPDSSVAYFLLAEAHAALGHDQAAIASFQKSLALTPENDAAISGLAALGVTYEQASNQVSPALLQTYIGKYQMRPGFSLTITHEENQLIAQATGQDKLPLFPTAEEGRFYFKAFNAQISFEQNETGTIDQLTLHQGGRNTTGKKIE